MKLTNFIRDAFVRAVMDDVPTTDYRELIQQRATENAVRLLPAAIQQVWKHAELRGFIAMDRTDVVDFYLYVPGTDVDGTKIEDDDIRQWKRLWDAQDEKLEDLRNKVRAVAYSVTTRKALLERLPEMEKYLPEDPAAATRMVPAIANLMTDLVKAGWPDGGKKKTAEPMAA